MASQVAPVYLISVNNTPKVAKELVAILINEVKQEYNIVHVANTSTIEGLQTFLDNLVVMPQALICSSQWTPEQQRKVIEVTVRSFPDIKTIMIPSGLNAKSGGGAVIEFLKGEVLGLGLPKRAKTNT